MISLRWAVPLTLLVLGPAVMAGACTPAGPDEGSGAGTTFVPEPGPTEICETQCIPQHPNGEWDYRALRGCLFCQACTTICVDQAGEMCGGADAGDLGCSAQAFNCGDCIGGPCALTQNPDTTFTGHCAQFGATCSLNPECVLFNNCVVKCLETVGQDAGTDADSGTDGGQI